MEAVNPIAPETISGDGFDVSEKAMSRAMRGKRTRSRTQRPLSELTPTELRARCHKQMWVAIRSGRLPSLAATEVKCTDCNERATCYDHRNYYHPLAVDPVCKGCNNRRGPGFPINPERKYTHELGGSSGKCWSALGAGRKEIEPKWVPAGPEKSVADFLDEHWITWEKDPQVEKMYQEACLMRKGRPYFLTSFCRGLYDWYGVEPI